MTLERGKPWPSTWGAQLLLAAISLLFCAAPVPGDVGGCGQNPQALDPATFFASKKAIDCQRCTECSLASQSCEKACNNAADIERDFPGECFPLVHDGEVCLRALLYASCDDYREFLDDAAPSVPTECDFCPAGAAK